MITLQELGVLTRRDFNKSLTAFAATLWGGLPEGSPLRRKNPLVTGEWIDICTGVCNTGAPWAFINGERLEDGVIDRFLDLDQELAGIAWDGKECRIGPGRKVIAKCSNWQIEMRCRSHDDTMDVQFFRIVHWTDGGGLPIGGPFN